MEKIIKYIICLYLPSPKEAAIRFNRAKEIELKQAPF